MKTVESYSGSQRQNLHWLESRAALWGCECSTGPFCLKQCSWAGAGRVWLRVFARHPVSWTLLCHSHPPRWLQGFFVPRMLQAHLDFHLCSSAPTCCCGGSGLSLPARCCPAATTMAQLPHSAPVVSGSPTIAWEHGQHLGSCLCCWALSAGAAQLLV